MAIRNNSGIPPLCATRHKTPRAGKAQPSNVVRMFPNAPATRKGWNGNHVFMFSAFIHQEGMTAARAKLRVNACFDLGRVVEGESRLDQAIRVGRALSRANRLPDGVLGKLLRFPARPVKAVEPSGSRHAAVEGGE